MKKSFKYMALALVGVLAVGCNNLDTEPLGSTVTANQKEEVLRLDPSMADAAVNGIPLSIKSSTGGYSTIHTNFGVPSLMLMMDQRGQDMSSPNVGYNWYTAALEMSDFGGRYYNNLIFWGVWYDLNLACNLVAGVIPLDTDVPSLQYNLGQALAYRGYAYYNLAQLYQFTYAKDPKAPCVPIITPENAASAAADGNPRATVEEVYQRVIEDYTNAIEVLDKADAEGVNRGSDKRFINSMVVYGLRARAHMMMQNWKEMEADASKALELATAARLAPLSIDEVSVPGFTRIDEKNIMWGVQNLASEGFTQGVVNFASMMGSWMNNGYCSVGVYRCINKKLYSRIESSDVRKGWWLNNLAKPATLPSDYSEYIDKQQGGDGEFIPYTQIKFGAANDDPGKPNGATDVPLMRVEEIYLMLAEAQGRQNVAKGLKTLKNFVSTYRNPAYAPTQANSADGFINEIWFQRRVELWGEGFSYYDIMRLETGIDRVGGGFPTAFVYKVAADDPVMLYEIVQTEAQANRLIGPTSNGAVKPTPVADED